jgi:hypothetical protein
VRSRPLGRRSLDLNRARQLVRGCLPAVIRSVGVPLIMVPDTYVHSPPGFLRPDQVHANREHRYTTVQPLSTEGTRYSRHLSTPIVWYLILALVCPRKSLPMTRHVTS